MFVLRPAEEDPKVVRDGALLILSGTPLLSDMPALERALVDQLRQKHVVRLDVSSLSVRQPILVETFSRALLAAGSWPNTQLLLCRADARVLSALRTTGAGRDLIVLDETDRGAEHQLRRPVRVRRRLQLTRRATSVQAAWTLVDELDAAWDFGDLLRDVHLVTAELVANAVRHAATQSVLTISSAPEGVHVAVRDYGVLGLGAEWAEAFDRQAGGLRRVAKTAVSCGVIPRTGGKTVWALLSVSNDVSSREEGAQE